MFALGAPVEGGACAVPTVGAAVRQRSDAEIPIRQIAVRLVENLPIPLAASRRERQSRRGGSTVGDRLNPDTGFPN